MIVLFENCATNGSLVRHGCRVTSSNLNLDEKDIFLSHDAQEGGLQSEFGEPFLDTTVYIHLRPPKADKVSDLELLVACSFYSTDCSNSYRVLLTSIGYIAASASIQLLGQLLGLLEHFPKYFLLLTSFYHISLGFHPLSLLVSNTYPNPLVYTLRPHSSCSLSQTIQLLI